MLKFRLLEPLRAGNCLDVLDELDVRMRREMTLENYSPYQLLFVRIYYSDIVNQRDLVAAHSISSLWASAAVSHIEQVPLSGAKIALQYIYTTDVDVSVEQIPHGILAHDKHADLIFQTLRPTSDEAKDMNSDEQTQSAFEEHILSLNKMGWTLRDNCLRTWFYVRDIDRHYQGVVAGRNSIFRRENLTADTHYIASTGIEGFPDNSQAIVSSDFFSLKGHEDVKVKYLKAPEYLNPTREYGVAFERGTSFELAGMRYVLISGTASIDKHGDVVHVGDVETQAGRMFLNIEKLLEQAGATLRNVAYMVVYLRDVTDYDTIERYMRFRFPETDFLIVKGSVCRPQWLIETECIARMPIEDEK